MASYTTNAHENTTVTWSLKGTDKDLLTLTNGTLTFTAAPNHETPSDHDNDNIYEATVVASTATENAELTVRITVLDVNEPPSPVAAPMTFELAPGAETYADMTTWFEDPEGDPLTYTVTTPADSTLKATVLRNYLKLSTQDQDGKTAVTVTASDGHPRTGPRTKPTITATATVARGTYPPSQPTNLTATPALARLDLTWNHPANTGGAPIYAHIIKYKVADTDDPFREVIFLSSATFYILGEIEENTTYEVKVRSCNRGRTGSSFIIRCGAYAAVTETTLGPTFAFAHESYTAEFYINAPSASSLPYASDAQVDNPPGTTYSINDLSPLEALANQVAFDPATRVLSGTPHSVGTANLTLTATNTSGLTATTNIKVEILNKLLPPTGLDVIPAHARDTMSGSSRFVTLTWNATASQNANNPAKVVYDVYVQAPGTAPKLIKTHSDPTALTINICLDSLQCRDEPPHTDLGLRQHDYIDAWIVARDDRSTTPLANSNQSQTVRIVPGPITTIDGDANEHGEGNAQVRWHQPQDVTGITIRWRQLMNDPLGNPHDDYAWTLYSESPPPQFNINHALQISSGTADPDNPNRRTTLITGLQPKTPYAVQLNFTQFTGQDTPDRKVFSGVDHYVYPSDEPQANGQRIASIPLRQYLPDRTYDYVFCEDTFDDPTETWLSLTQHAFQEWHNATDGLIQARRLLKESGNPEECADYDTYIQVITQSVKQSLSPTDELPTGTPSEKELEDHITNLINIYLDTNLKSNMNKDKNLNEIRMIQNGRYTAHLNNMHFVQIATASGINTGCITSQFTACAIPTQTPRFGIPFLDNVHRSTDIHIMRTRVQPPPGETLTSAHLPGNDTVWDDQDVKFNYCTASNFNQKENPANTYEVLMHEIGHALGLFDGAIYPQPTDPNQNRNHPNMMIYQTLMSHDTVEGQSCSPHPLDIMALYAIYQTED